MEEVNINDTYVKTEGSKLWEKGKRSNNPETELAGKAALVDPYLMNINFGSSVKQESSDSENKRKIMEAFDALPKQLPHTPIGAMPARPETSPTQVAPQKQPEAIQQSHTPISRAA